MFNIIKLLYLDTLFKLDMIPLKITDSPPGETLCCWKSFHNHSAGFGVFLPPSGHSRSTAASSYIN